MTEGVVLVSDLQRSRDSDGGFMYRPEISYRYSVHGQELIASRTRFGDGLSLSWSAPAVRVTRQYKAGTPVHVYFDPQDPAEAVLEPGISAYLFAWMVFGVLFLVLGFAAVLAA